MLQLKILQRGARATTETYGGQINIWKKKKEQPGM